MPTDSPLTRNSAEKSEDKKELEVEPKLQDHLLTGRTLFLAFLGFNSSLFLVYLDQTIVSTALPRIVSQFNALDKVSWVSSAYALTQAGLVLSAAQLVTLASIKKVFLSSIFLFELGSLFCAVAPSINFLILGRALAGAGAAGMVMSLIACISTLTKFEDRPALLAITGTMFAVASIIGPLIGGAFTDHLTWRWCFWINLPFGAASIVIIFFIISSTRPVAAAQDMKELAKRLDYGGSALVLGAVTCLLLALTWGGVTKSWNNPAVVTTLVLFAICAASFILWEYKRGEDAMLPLVIFKNRTQIGASLAAFWIILSFLVVIYYLPLWYQAKGSTPSRSGISVLPFMISTVIFALISGGAIKISGRYLPWLLISPAIGAIGAGLLYTIDDTTSNKRMIGYQIIYGIGIGGSFQNVFIAAQAAFKDNPRRVVQASSAVSFFQQLGGVAGLAIGGTLFNNQLRQNLGQLSSLLPQSIVSEVEQSVTSIALLPLELQNDVIKAYVLSLRPIFLLGVAGCALSGLSAMLMKNIDIRDIPNLALA